jgi:hypothetical protein
MAIITDATFTWSDPVTLSADEIWQSRGDEIFVTTTSAPVDSDGLSLRKNEALRFSAGSVVRYRK